ncbi:hypothetical protein S83_042589, partial [Arachis hypogaea]
PTLSKNKNKMLQKIKQKKAKSNKRDANLINRRKTTPRKDAAKEIQPKPQKAKMEKGKC